MNIPAQFIDLIIIPRGPIEPKPAWVGIIVLLVVFGGPILYFSLNRNKKQSKWEDGIWPADFPFNRDNLMESYIGAAAILVRRDVERMHGKLPFLNSYLHERFPKEYYDFKDSYRHSLRHPVSIQSLADWLNHYVDPVEKTHLVRFLISLALSDGYLNDTELAAIMKFSSALHLDWKEFESDIPGSQRAQTAGDSIRERHLRTLGLSADPSENDIRSAYRSLVKIYHPDRFANESQDEQKRATEQFRKIQEAYEALTT